MTKDEEKQCRTLASVCELRSESDIDRYIEVIEQLRRSSSHDVLRHMLRCLRDTDAGEVQYELVEASESYPIGVYVNTFLEEGLEVQRAAPEWFELMFQSILNTDGCRDLAIKVINRMDMRRKEAYRRIIRQIAKEAPQYELVLEQLS